jgi:hypothetical protein
MFLVALTGSLVGCVAPGSAVTQVRFAGQLKDESGEPLGNLPIQICLPAAYGLAGLDAAMGKPADYGHQDQWVSLTTDAEGRYWYEFQPVTYSVSYWLFPPLGPMPKDPPKPVVGLRTRLADGEWFILYAEGDSSRALRWREGTEDRTPLPNGVSKPVLTLRPATEGSPPGWTTELTALRP